MTFEQGAAAGPGWGRGLPGTLGEGRAGTARGGPRAGAEPGPGPGYGREPQLWEGAPAMGESPTNRGKSVEWESLQLFLFPSLSPPPCSQGHFSPLTHSDKVLQQLCGLALVHPHCPTPLPKGQPGSALCRAPIHQSCREHWHCPIRNLAGHSVLAMLREPSGFPSAAVGSVSSCSVTAPSPTGPLSAGLG